MITEALIRKLADEKVTGTELFILEVLVKKGNRIVVTLDGDRSVTIEDCIKVSRHIEGNLDREVEDFELQVTTGGADHPLQQFRQYPKHIGRTLRVVMQDDSEVKGILRTAAPEAITLALIPDKKDKTKGKTTEDTLQNISLDNIKESYIEISFTQPSH